MVTIKKIQDQDAYLISMPPTSIECTGNEMRELVKKFTLLQESNTTKYRESDAK